MKFMSKFFISILMYLSVFLNLNAQEENASVSDSIVVQEKYGLRLGLDASKLICSFIESDYNGFEINGDYRLGKRLYVAGELGAEEKTTATPYLNSTAKGSYFKGGLDYNMYENWAGMDNMVYSGIRFGISNFSQTLNNYTIYDTNSQTWGPHEITESERFSGLTTGWLELLLGVKAEVLKNLFLGVNFQIKGRLFETAPNNFENIYIPGFGRTFDSGSFSSGLGYTISYLIPLYKRDR